MPLHHVPLSIAFVLGTCSQQNAAWQRDVLAARVQHATGPNIPHPCCIPVNMVLRLHLYQQPTYMPPMTATGDRPMSGLHYVAPGNRLQLGCGEARFIAHGVNLAGTYPVFPTTRQCNFWTHWDLSPGPSACGADVTPLHHVPHRHVRCTKDQQQHNGRAGCMAPATRTRDGVSRTLVVAGSGAEGGGR